MGKPRMDLLKGIEEQENVINDIKTYQKESKTKLQDFQQTTPQAEIAPKPSQSMEITSKVEKATEKTNTKPKKAVMGFRAETDKMEMWKIYADVTAQEISVMCTAAIDEYIRNHKLTSDQQKLFDFKMQVLETEKQMKESI